MTLRIRMHHPLSRYALPHHLQIFPATLSFAMNTRFPVTSSVNPSLLRVEYAPLPPHPPPHDHPRQSKSKRGPIENAEKASSTWQD
jgi:hypothetical protein